MFPVRKAAWLLVVWSTLTVGSIAIVRTYSGKLPPTPERTYDAASTVATKVVNHNQARSDAVLVSLLPSGFEPSAVTHPAGKFLFGVNNRTGLDDLRLQLTDERGRPVGEKRMVKEKIWRKVIEPKSGKYVLRVLDHPSWWCELTITP